MHLATATRQISPTPVPSDMKDILDVFVYSNLSAITAPNPIVSLPPNVRAALVVALNYTNANLGFNSDIEDVVKVFILNNTADIDLTTPVP